MIRILTLALLLGTAPGFAQRILVGTSAPKDTYWHNTLLEIGQE
jgi:hypothetical protein